MKQSLTEKVPQRLFYAVPASLRAQTMKNIKLTIAYDGTDFHGWQIQPGRPTIQGALVEIAERLVGSRTVVYGAGRTDAGVHALGQVANFRADTRLDAAEFQRAFNALLPPAIRVIDAEEVELRFHSRWDAQAKTYLYRICRGRVLSPFDRFFALHYPFPLDEDAMAEAAQGERGVDALTRMGARYNELLADRTTLMLQLQGFAACGDADFIADAICTSTSSKWSAVRRASCVTSARMSSS